MNSFRDRIRRILPMLAGERKLRMPVLETERLVLRRLDRSDLNDIVAWDLPHAQSVEVAAWEFLDYCFREYRERGIGPWGMQLKETGRIAGNCGFPHIIFERHCGEVNSYVAPSYRGQGFTPEALKALFEFGFRDIGLTRIQARCDVDNFSSERVTQKVGMKFEGLVAHPGHPTDPTAKQKLFAILRNTVSGA